MRLFKSVPAHFIALLLMFVGLLKGPTLKVLNGVGLVSDACVVPDFPADQCGARQMLEALAPFAPVAGVIILYYALFRFMTGEFNHRMKSFETRVESAEKLSEAALKQSKDAFQNVGKIGDVLDKRSKELSEQQAARQREFEDELTRDMAHRFEVFASTMHSKISSIDGKIGVIEGREKQLVQRMNRLEEAIKEVNKRAKSQGFPSDGQD